MKEKVLNWMLGSSTLAFATNPAMCDRETMAALFDTKEAEYEAKAEACREPPRDMVTQALHAGFAAGMRFAAETVRGKPHVERRSGAEPLSKGASGPEPAAGDGYAGRTGSEV